MRNLKRWMRMIKQRKIIVTIFAFLFASTFGVKAQNADEQTWWFNVELIIFKRALLPTNTEDFEQARFDIDTANTSNFLYLAALKEAQSFTYLRGYLPQCSRPPQIEDKYDASVDFEYQAKNTRHFAEKASSPETALVELEGQSLDDMVSNQSLLKNLGKGFENFLTPQLANKRLSDELESSTANPDNSSTEIDSEAIASIESQIENINKQIQDIANSEVSLLCIKNEESAPPLTVFSLDKIGPRLFASNSDFNAHKQLLTPEELVLNDYAQKIFRQRDISPLLYTAWRQEVEFGSENAEFVRVRAGQLLETKQQQAYEDWLTSYQALSEASKEEDQNLFFERLKTALNEKQDVDWLGNHLMMNETDESTVSTQKQYELDGRIKVYLDYVNQVPYLHIDNEFNHYSLNLDANGNSELTSYPLKQKRRVISKQTHYFDHPAFGIIVRLERFTPPQPNVAKDSAQ